MATSGSVDFSVTRDELYRAAFEDIGIAIEGEALQPEDIKVADIAMNMMIKAWQAYGLNLWARKNQSILLTALKGEYSLGASGDIVMNRPLRILECDRQLISDGTSTEMTPLSLSEYHDLPNKAQDGTPVNYFYDPTLTNGSFKLWPVPGATESALYTIEIVYQAPLEDMDSSVDDFAFPQEWLEPLRLGLAYRLSSKYALGYRERILLRKDAAEALELAQSFDVADTSLYFQPDYQRAQ